MSEERKIFDEFCQETFDPEVLAECDLEYEKAKKMGKFIRMLDYYEKACIVFGAKTVDNSLGEEDTQVAGNTAMEYRERVLNFVEEILDIEKV